MARGNASGCACALAFIACAAIATGIFAPLLAVDSLLYHTAVRYWDLAGEERFGVLGAVALVLPAVRYRRRGLILLAAIGLWTALAYPWLSEWWFPERPGFLQRVGASLRRPVDEMATRIVLEYDMLRPLWGAYCLVGGTLLLSLVAWRVRRRRAPASPPGKPFPGRGGPRRGGALRG